VDRGDPWQIVGCSFWLWLPRRVAVPITFWRQQQPGKLDIETATIKRDDVRRVVSTSGTVRALVTVDIGSQLSGNIGAINVDYSTKVKQDQVLARDLGGWRDRGLSRGARLAAHGRP
jgi:multidrug efflux pump subunit AcrA (membrane-fusion protein)